MKIQSNTQKTRLKIVEKITKCLTLLIRLTTRIMIKNKMKVKNLIMHFNLQRKILNHNILMIQIIQKILKLQKITKPLRKMKQVKIKLTVLMKKNRKVINLILNH